MGVQTCSLAMIGSLQTWYSSWWLTLVSLTFLTYLLLQWVLTKLPHIVFACMVKERLLLRLLLPSSTHGFPTRSISIKCNILCDLVTHSKVLGVPVICLFWSFCTRESSSRDLQFVEQSADLLALRSWPRSRSSCPTPHWPLVSV